MTEKNFLTKTLTNSVLSRRSFLKWSAALGGTAVLAGGINYGLKTVQAAAENAGTQGKWVMAACWHNCGGRCANVAYVVDGVVTKQKTDDTHPDSPNYPQMRGCGRGKSQRHQVFGADRLKYPMKRANWQPGTGGDKSLRGKDEWVRISWDEALTLVANETKRIVQTYGNKAILNSNRLLNAFGGGVPTWGQVSCGAWPEPNALMAGNMIGANDRLDYRNTKLLVLWGSNPIWSSGGSPTYNYLQAKKAGAKVIMVTPQYNETAQGLADEWIPVRPSTDAALLIGMAHYMITNNLQDQAFLDKYTVGFDSTHMPEGTYYKDNFRDYVLGTYDGVPKTPEWAAEICGTSPNTIRKFALEIATTKPMIFSSSWAPARTYLGSQMCQAFLTVGWMTGNFGISGGGVVNIGHSGASYGGPALVSGGGTGVKSLPNPYGSYSIAHNDLTRKDVFCIVWDEQWDAVLNGSFILPGYGKQTVDIHMIWNIGDGSGGNNLNQQPNIMKGIEAYRKVEFVVSNDIVLSSKSKYADIVLPVTTPWEKEGGGLASMAGGEALLFYSQVSQPLYEAKDENWINRELAKKLDLDPEVVDPISLKQRAFNSLAGSKVIKSDASGYEPLVTITDADIAEWGVDGKPQTGRITLKEFQSTGVYQVPRSPGDNFTYISGKAFRDDPIKNPAKTASGKLEIYCQALSDQIKNYGWTTVPPIPKYNRPYQGVEDTYTDWENKIKGPYPLQLLTTHYGRRSHSVFDNILQLRKAFPQELWINTIDAEERGIKTGDTVLVTSRWGKVLRPAYVTERIVPGVVDLGEGAWVQMDETQGIDLAGATNTLSGTTPTDCGVQPWNTNNAQVEKWNGEQLKPDYTWPQRIPIKEA